MDDFADAQRANLAEASEQRWRWISLYVLAVMIFGIGLYAYMETQRVAISIGFWILGMILLMLRRLKVAGATSAFRKQAEQFRGMKLIVDDEAIRFRSEGRNLALPWPALRRFRESETLFVLYPSGGFLAIPKRALSESQVEQFRQALVEKVSQR
ncbi:MAG TPA: YcxB family protein [Clostridia bacterium]|nr:YcxB family protein [Clostridia bacterium]